MLPLVLMYVGTSLLLMGLSMPMILRMVKPNPWYGFRTPRTLKDPDIWYPANAHSGVLLLIAGFINAVTAVILALLPGMNKDAYAILCTVVMVSTLLWAVVRSFRYLKRL